MYSWREGNVLRKNVCREKDVTSKRRMFSSKRKMFSSKEKECSVEEKECSVEEKESADIAKITRKRLKPGKHEHGNGRARKKPGESYQKSKLTQPTQTNQTNQTGQQYPNNVQSQQFQQFQTATISANNAKFPYLEKEKYEIWAMKMEYWIQNADHNLWRIVQQGNSPKRLGKDAKGNTNCHPPALSLDEACCCYNGRIRDIWMAVKARFGGNEESKKMRKTMLKQQQARPDNDDINLKFLRALPSSWSQVALALKTRGGLDSMSFDDLYNKLRSLELDVRIGHSYGVKAAAAPTHSAFIGAASSGSKLTYSDQQSIVPSVYQTSGRSDNIMECVLHSFVAENEPDQDMIYEDFDQVDQLEMEELDLKWQMAMLSLRINRFEKKAGRKMNYNNKQPARFDRIDSMVNWSDHAAENKTGEVEKVYGMMAGLHTDNGGAGVSDAAAEFALMGISPKYFGEDEVFDLSRPSTMYPEPVEEEVKPLYSWFVKAGEMHAVPPSITGTYMPIPYKSDIEETQDSETMHPCDSSLKTKGRLPPAVDIKGLC
ncbi:hypothetical protein Tco_0458364 [Tanacetum coccineum]